MTLDPSSSIVVSTEVEVMEMQTQEAPPEALPARRCGCGLTFRAIAFEYAVKDLKVGRWAAEDYLDEHVAHNRAADPISESEHRVLDGNR